MAAPKEATPEQLNLVQEMIVVYRAYLGPSFTPVELRQAVTARLVGLGWPERRADHAVSIAAARDAVEARDATE